MFEALIINQLPAKAIFRRQNIKFDDKHNWKYWQAVLKIWWMEMSDYHTYEKWEEEKI